MLWYYQLFYFFIRILDWYKLAIFCILAYLSIFLDDLIKYLAFLWYIMHIFWMQCADKNYLWYLNAINGHHYLDLPILSVKIINKYEKIDILAKTGHFLVHGISDFSQKQRWGKNDSSHIWSVTFLCRGIQIKDLQGIAIGQYPQNRSFFSIFW